MQNRPNLIFAVATLALSAVTQVVAEETAPSHPSDRSDSPAVAIPISALSARERNMLSRSDDNLRARVLPNRAVALNLQGRFQNMAIVSTEQNTGQLITSCSIDEPISQEDKVEAERAE
jgi:hypothetical protein